MEVKLYGDVFLLVNGSMDILILSLTAVIAKRKIPIWRLISSAILMAACPLLGIAFKSLEILYSIFGSYIILTLGIFIAFLPKRFKEYLNLMLIAYMSAFTVGGCGMALFFLLGAPPIFGGDVVYRTRLFPLKLLVVLIAVFYSCMKLGSCFLESKLINSKEYCTAVIRHGGKEAVLTAFIDNGNGLRDPYNGYGVMIGAFEALQVFFTYESRKMFFAGNFSQSEMQEFFLSEEISLAPRLIAYTSLGQDNGLLLVFRPQLLKLTYLGTEFFNREVMIGVYLGSFKGAYDAIISPEAFLKDEQIIKKLARGDYHEGV